MQQVRQNYRMGKETIQDLDQTIVRVAKRVVEKQTKDLILAQLDDPWSSPEEPINEFEWNTLKSYQEKKAPIYRNNRQ